MYIVMSATEITARDSNRNRCFETNAVDLTKEQAEAEAERRNILERAAGHNNVTWYPSLWIDPMELLRRRRAGEPLVQDGE